MSAFDSDRCAIPSVWCGSGKFPRRQRGDEKYYTKNGTGYECMRKGFGAGMYTERGKSLDPQSLQNIKYVGDSYEINFITYNIFTLNNLKNVASNTTAKKLENILKQVFTKKNNIIDKRAYNSTLLWLYKNGHNKLPQCLVI